MNEDEFEAHFGAKLGLEDHPHLIDSMFAGMAPHEQMVQAVRDLRAAGTTTALVSNSWSTNHYDRDLLAEIFDAVVISGEVGLHKPEPEIYLRAAEEAGVEPVDCVFVDDLRENCEGAEAVGMTAIRHRDAAETIPKLAELTGVELPARQAEPPAIITTPASARPTPAFWGARSRSPSTKWASTIVNAGYIEPPTATTGSSPIVEARAKRLFAVMSKKPMATQRPPAFRDGGEARADDGRGRERREDPARPGGDDHPARLVDVGRGDVEQGEEPAEPERRGEREDDRPAREHRVGVPGPLLDAEQHHARDRDREPGERDRARLLAAGEPDPHGDDHPERGDRRDHAHRAHRHRGVEGARARPSRQRRPRRRAAPRPS